jgi:hypothetical protein
VTSARSDRGAGVLATTFGVATFLALLGFAAQTLLELFARSAIEDVAVATADRVAVSGADDSALRSVDDEALARARRELGSSHEVDLEFRADPTGRTVRLHVRSERFGIDRVIVRRRERAGAGR